MRLMAYESSNFSAYGLSDEDYGRYCHLQALVPLADSFPTAVLARATPYSTRRWPVLRMQARVSGAADLLDSNPALGWALANHACFRLGHYGHTAEVEVREIVRRRQRDILAWLGFERSEALRRIFQRITPTAVNLENLLLLRNAVTHPGVVRALSHQPVLTADVLRFVCEEQLRPFATPRLLIEMAANQIQIYGFSNCLADTMMEIQSSPTASHLAPPKPIPNIQALDAILESYRQHQDLMLHAFPPPPFAGTENVVPLTNPQALWTEGKAMDHCVADYAEFVASGAVYVYAVHAPIRATLAIGRESKRWVVQEFSGASNEDVPISVSTSVLHELFVSQQTF